MAEFVFDPLSDSYRWCIYCQADCWPEPENQCHGVDCPTNTGLYPISEDDVLPTGDWGGCSVCDQPFSVGDHYVHISDETGLIVTCPALESYTWITCPPCGIMQLDPR